MEEENTLAESDATEEKIEDASERTDLPLNPDSAMPLRISKCKPLDLSERKYSTIEDVVLTLTADMMHHIVHSWKSVPCGTSEPEEDVEVPEMVDEDGIPVKGDDKGQSEIGDSLAIDDRKGRFSAMEEPRRKSDVGGVDKEAGARTDVKAMEEAANSKETSKRPSKIDEEFDAERWRRSTQEIPEVEEASPEEVELEWRKTFPQEEVEVVFTNGNMYEGHVARKMLNSTGKLIWSDGGSYAGKFVDNEITGKGMLRLPDYSIYDGELYKGWRHGYGVFQSPNGRFMYDGFWKMGKKHGAGCLYYESTDNFYVGDWVEDVREGYGLRQYPSGTRYEGEWHKGFRHGYGTMVWNNNEVYQGEWKYGKMDGHGEYTWDAFLNKTFTYPCRNVYRGRWKNGERHGIGEFEYSSGCRYLGEFKHDVRDGDGVLYSPNGLAYNVTCKDDKSQSKTPLPIHAPNCQVNLSTFLEHVNEDQREDERIWLENCVVRYLYHLKGVYYQYATVAVDGEITFDVFMMRIFLWQLLRDCKLNGKGYSLVQFDRMLAQNPYAQVKQTHYPFEPITFRQFLYSLLEISWVVYGKLNNGLTYISGRLASAFCKVLEDDIFPNAGKNVGNVLFDSRDLLPMSQVYLLYTNIGEPHSARNFLKTVYREKIFVPKAPAVDVRKYQFGWNVIGQNGVLFLPRRDKLPEKDAATVAAERQQDMTDIPTENISLSPSQELENSLKETKNDEEEIPSIISQEIQWAPDSQVELDSQKRREFVRLIRRRIRAQLESKGISMDSTSHISCLRNVQPSEMRKIMVMICPGIGPEEHITSYIDYEFTFLEFYEILLECAKHSAGKIAWIREQAIREEIIQEIELARRSEIENRSIESKVATSVKTTLSGKKAEKRAERGRKKSG